MDPESTQQLTLELLKLTANYASLLLDHQHYDQAVDVQKKVMDSSVLLRGRVHCATIMAEGQFAYASWLKDQSFETATNFHRNLSEESDSLTSVTRSKTAHQSHTSASGHDNVDAESSRVEDALKLSSRLQACAIHSKDSNKPRESEGLLRSAHLVLSGSLGHEHHETLYCRRLLAVAAYNSGDFEKAERIGRFAIRDMMQFLGPTNRLTIVTISNHTSTLMRSSRFKDAEYCIDLAVKLAKEHLEESDDGRKTTLSNAVAIYHGLEKCGMAGELAHEIGECVGTASPVSSYAERGVSRTGTCPYCERAVTGVPHRFLR
jgi:hypothetical protein